MQSELKWLDIHALHLVWRCSTVLMKTRVDPFRACVHVFSNCNVLSRNTAFCVWSWESETQTARWDEYKSFLTLVTSKIVMLALFVHISGCIWRMGTWLATHELSRYRPKCCWVNCSEFENVMGSTRQKLLWYPSWNRC